MTDDERPTHNPLPTETVIAAVRGALGDAWSFSPRIALAPKDLHSARSAHLVKQIAARLRAQADPARVRVFSRDYDGNRADFDLNELHFDVQACEVVAPAVAGARRDVFLGPSLLQLESELAEGRNPDVLDGRTRLELRKDFSKIMTGGAPLRVFVASYCNSTLNQQEFLLGAARLCGAQTLLLFLFPHPSRWEPRRPFSPEAEPAFVLRGRQWQPL
jgi:hypothetical protein